MNRVGAGLDWLMAAMAGLLVVALLACVAAGVVTRALNAPLIWTDEIARFLMIWLAAFGWMLGSRKRIHVRIRFFQDLLPRRLHGLTELAIQLALALFGAVVAIYGVELVEKNLELEATTVEISMAWMYVPMVPAGLVMAAQALNEAVQALRRMAA